MRYLEDLLVRIDAPFPDYLDITFFMDLEFDFPQLYRLYRSRRGVQRIRPSTGVDFQSRNSAEPLPPERGKVGPRTRLRLQILCEELDYQLSSLAQVCSSSFPLVSAVEDLQIWGDHDRLPSSHWAVDMETGQWLEILDPFTALKNLYLRGNNRSTCLQCTARAFRRKG